MERRIRDFFETNHDRVSSQLLTTHLPNLEHRLDKTVFLGRILYNSTFIAPDDEQTFSPSFEFVVLTLSNSNNIDECQDLLEKVKNYHLNSIVKNHRERWIALTDAFVNIVMRAIPELRGVAIDVTK